MLGPTIAGTVLLTAGIGLHNDAPELSLAFEIVGPALLAASAGVLIAGIVRYVRDNHRTRAVASARGAEFAAFSIAPSESGIGAMAAATWRF